MPLSRILRLSSKGGRTRHIEPSRFRDFAALENRRRAAVALLQNGATQAEVAKRVGVSKQSLSRWVAAYKKDGPEGLARRLKGRRPFLDERQRREAIRLLVAEARGTRRSAPMWTINRAMHFVHDRFGVVYKRTSLIGILHDAGFTPRGPSGWYMLDAEPD